MTNVPAGEIINITVFFHFKKSFLEDTFWEVIKKDANDSAKSQENLKMTVILILASNQ